MLAHTVPYAEALHVTLQTRVLGEKQLHQHLMLCAEATHNTAIQDGGSGPLAEPSARIQSQSSTALPAL